MGNFLETPDMLTKLLQQMLETINSGYDENVTFGFSEFSKLASIANLGI